MNKREIEEIEEGVNVPANYEESVAVPEGKLANLKANHPKFMTALKIGGIGLLLGLLGAGCYTMGKKKGAEATNDPYDIDLDKLDEVNEVDQ